MQAVHSVDPDLPWERFADAVLPVFRRRRPYPRQMPALVYQRRPPGVDVGVAIDIGPAFMHVDASLLDRWHLTHDEVLDRALANVRARTTSARLEPVFYGEIGGVSVGFFQSGQSIGSALILAPDLVAERFGESDQFLLAPMRDLLVSVPMSAGRMFAADLYESIAEEDPNCLDLPVLSFVGGRLEIASEVTVPRGYLH